MSVAADKRFTTGWLMWADNSYSIREARRIPQEYCEICLEEKKKSQQIMQGTAGIFQFHHACLPAPSLRDQENGALIPAVLTCDTSSISAFVA